jgi:hypothetical protein
LVIGVRSIHPHRVSWALLGIVVIRAHAERAARDPDHAGVDRLGSARGLLDLRERPGF